MIRNPSRLLPRLLLTTALVLVAPHAMAAQKKPEEPVLLEANTLIYDDIAKTVTAQGDVQLSQKGQIVRANKMIYDRKTEIVTADGQVRIWQPSGEVIFAEHAQLSRDMKQGFVKQTAMLMTDDSRFIAAEGERTEGRYVRLNRALYTACEPCKAHPEKPPIWQVRADRVIHDTKTHDVIYRNAVMEVGGVPVFYSPYLSHPDPTVKRRSGFLAPVIGSRANLGFVSRNYYYLDIAPNMDATIEGSYSAKHGALVATEWRRKGKQSQVTLNASLTRDDIPDDHNGAAKTNRVRGHFFLDASYQFDANWRAEASIRRTTDDTFLDLWNFTTDDILTSRADVERMTERSRAVVEMISFQDLRSNITAAEPQVLHMAWQTQSLPHDLMGGRWTLGAETRSLARSHGQDSTRGSVITGWRREDVAPAGVVVTTEATARVDSYVATNMTTTNADVETTRPFVQGQITASWPLVKVGETGQQFIEPVAQLSIAPRQRRAPDDVPNEDSIGLEFDPSNLFRANRYAGSDIIDGGSRAVYGLRGGWTANSGSSVTAAVGQSHDFAEHPNYPDGSGLETQSSDIVGTVNANVPNWVDAAYSLRLDNSTYEPREHDLSMTVGPSWLQGSASYLYVERAAQDSLLGATRQELGVGAKWTFADHWSLIGSHRTDLERSNGALSTGVALTYQDECLTFSLNALRDHVARSGLSSGDSIFFRLIFKNIGEFESPSISPDIFSKSSSSQQQ